MKIIMVVTLMVAFLFWVARNIRSNYYISGRDSLMWPASDTSWMTVGMMLETGNPRIEFMVLEIDRINDVVTLIPFPVQENWRW